VSGLTGISNFCQLMALILPLGSRTPRVADGSDET